jgi:hypothetical protein
MCWACVNGACFARLAGGCLLAALLLAGCGGEATSTESRLRAVVEQLEAAVEAGSVSDAAELLHPAYRDQRHASRREATASLLAYLRRHRQIYLFTLVRELDMAADETVAQMVVYVAMGGVPLESLDAAVSLKADLYRFALTLERLDGEWLVRQSAWQRVGPEMLGR